MSTTVAPSVPYVPLSTSLDLVSQIIDKFHASEDIQQCRHYQHRHDQLQAWRQQEQSDREQSVQHWQQRFQQSKSVLEQRPSHQEHLKRLHANEQKLLLQSKRVSALEWRLSQLQDQRKQVQQQLQQIESMEPVERTSSSSRHLQWRMYRALGVEALRDEQGQWVKCRVHCKERNDVQTIYVNTGRTSFFYTNAIWDLCTPPEEK